MLQLDPLPGEVCAHDDTLELTQPFRLAESLKTVHIACDRINGQDVIYWDDIEQDFPGLQSVRLGNFSISKLRDPSTRQRMMPCCIRRYPGMTLEVHLSTPPDPVPTVASIGSPQDNPAQTQEQGNLSDIDAGTNKIDPTLEVDTGEVQAISTTTTPCPSEPLSISMVITDEPFAISIAAADEHRSDFTAMTPYLSEPHAITTVTILSTNGPQVIPTTPYTCGPPAITTETITSIGEPRYATIIAATASTSKPQRIATATILFVEGSQTILPENLGCYNTEITTDSMAPCLLQLSANLTNAAKKGDSMAQCNLGFIYLKGKEYGVLQSFKIATDWMTKSAKAGNVHAACNLGILFQNGIGVDQSYQKAMDWYMKVANPGLLSQWLYKPTKPAIARAQLHVGMLHYFGHGVPKDYQKAAEWFLKASHLGNAEAQNAIGFLYCIGKGVSRDFKKAIEWFWKAADQENAYAQNNIGALYVVGNGVAQDDCEAVEWFSKAALQGVVTAQSSLGALYARDSGILHDYEKAAKWFRKAADKDDAFSQRELGVLYSKGKGVPQDDRMAFEIFMKSAQQGYADAQSDLGYAFANGLGTFQNETLAAEWFLKAADQGHARARIELRLMYDAKVVNPPPDDFPDVWWAVVAANDNAKKPTRRGSGWYKEGKEGKGEEQGSRRSRMTTQRTSLSMIVQETNLSSKGTFNFG